MNYININITKDVQLNNHIRLLQIFWTQNHYHLFQILRITTCFFITAYDFLQTIVFHNDTSET